MRNETKESQPVFSLICIYNNADVMTRNIGSSLGDQMEILFEKILIDNSAFQFDSAAKALNEAAKLAKGQYLIFVHQDVTCADAYWIKRIREYASQCPNMGAAGCVGIDGLGKKVGFIIDRKAIWGRPLSQPVEVQTLDEVLLIIEQKVFNQLGGFDENLGGWHCYGADLCMRMSGLGKKNYVFPLFIHHRSASTNLNGLFDIQKNLRKKYGKTLSSTTAGGISGLYLIITRIKSTLGKIKVPLVQILSFLGLGIEDNILSFKLKKYEIIIIFDYYKPEYKASYPKMFTFFKFSNNPAWKEQKLTYYFLDNDELHNIAAIGKRFSANSMIISVDLKERIPGCWIENKLTNSYYRLKETLS